MRGWKGRWGGQEEVETDDSLWRPLMATAEKGNKGLNTHTKKILRHAVSIKENRWMPKNVRKRIMTFNSKNIWFHLVHNALTQNDHFFPRDSLLAFTKSNRPLYSFTWLTFRRRCARFAVIPVILILFYSKFKQCLQSFNYFEGILGKSSLHRYLSTSQWPKLLQMEV